MSTFLRLLTESDKAEALMAVCNHFRQGENDPRSFEVASESFNSIPREGLNNSARLRDNASP